MSSPEFPFAPDPSRPHGYWGPHIGEIHAAIAAGPPPPPTFLSPEQLAAREAWEAEQRRAQSDAHLRWLERAAAEVAQIRDPAERTVRVVAVAIGVPHNSSEGWPPTGFAVDAEALHVLLPDLFPRGERISMERPPWNHDLIRSWFLGATRESPTHDVPVTVSGIFGPRIKRVEAWIFGYGSTRVHEPKEGHPHYGGIAVGRDGRVMYDSNSMGWSRGPRSEGFNARALARMATLAGLAPLGAL